MEQQQIVDIRAYLKVLSRRRWVMIVTFVTVVITTALVTWQLTPIYQAEAAVEVLPTSLSSSEASQLLESLMDPTRGLQTQVELIQSDAVLQLAARELGLSSSRELKKNLEVELIPDTQIVEIRVEHERPEEARDWTNAVADSYITFRRDRALETSLAASQEISSDINQAKARIAELDAEADNPATNAERERAIAQLNALEAQLQVLPDAEAVRRGGGTVISPAKLPEAPERPRKVLNLALAAVVGAVLSLGMALLAENLDDRLKSPEEVEQRVEAPILGYIPLVKEWGERQRPILAMDSESGSGAEEAYRTLITNLRFVSLERPLQTILVTSPVAEAGKSTTAANLAAMLAQGGEKVVLVSADLRRPSAHRFFGLGNSVGLLQALDRRFALRDALQEDQIRSLRVLAGGGLPPNPTEILDSARFSEILSSLQKLADVVIIDSAPVLGLGDSSVLASQVDGILLVIRTNSVTKREVAHAADQLRKAGGTIIGCVLNAVDAEDDYGYYYHYYYSQYSANENGRTSPKKPGKKHGVEP